MNPFLRRSILLLTLASAPAIVVAAPSEDRPWTVRFGLHNVDPTSDASATSAGAITVDDRAGASFNIEYRLSQHLRVDLLASLPFHHDIRLDGGQIGSTRHLPPTLTLQWHPRTGARIDPFMGIGLNYTLFFEESLDIPASLELEDSVGLAGRVGVDYHCSPRWLIGVDLRYLNIESEARLDGTVIGDVTIDPLAYGIQLGYRF